MKKYDFANITVRPYPNMCDVNNKWIFTPDIKVVINVSQKYKTEIVEAIKQKGIEYFHLPLDEEVPDIGWENVKSRSRLLRALTLPALMCLFIATVGNIVADWL